MSRKRILLWLLGAPAYVAALVPVGTFMAVGTLSLLPGPRDTSGWAGAAFELLEDGEWWAFASAVASAIAVTQAVFLLPVVRFRPPQGERSRPLAVSLVVGAGVGALLTIGLGLALAEFAAGLVKGDHGANPWGDEELLSLQAAGIGALLTLAASWALWSFLLLVFSRELWADRALGRLTAVLFGGTLVELLVVLPIDLMVRRRTDCYCATGTFWSLCLSVVAVLWLAGPGVVLAVTSRRRRLVHERHCARCGHARGPAPGPRCPECGFEWSAGPCRSAAARATGGT